MQSLSNYQWHFSQKSNKIKNILMETQNTLTSQSNIEKEKWSWKNQAPWLQAILQSYSNQSSMVLTEKQKYRLSLALLIIWPDCTPRSWLQGKLSESGKGVLLPIMGLLGSALQKEVSKLRYNKDKRGYRHLEGPYGPNQGIRLKFLCKSLGRWDFLVLPGTLEELGQTVWFYQPGLRGCICHLWDIWLWEDSLNSVGLFPFL